MSKERYNQIIDEAYKNYEKQYSTFEIGIVKSIASNNPMVDSLLKNNSSILSQEQFTNKCKSDPEFSEKWGLKIEERELSLEERAKWLQDNKGYDLLVGNLDHDHILEVVVEEGPTKLIYVEYNGEKIEVHE
jgi:hypothetical protein